MVSRNTVRAGRVLFVAVQDVDYPRNRRVRQFFEETLEMQVEVIHLSSTPGFLRHTIELLVQGWRMRGPFSVVVLAEFSIPFAWVAWLLARKNRAIFIVDFFVGQVETHIGDRAASSRSSARGLAYRFFDWFALRSATFVTSDTQVRADALASRLRRWQRVYNLPVGAPSWARAVEMPSPKVPQTAAVRLLYYGNYIPLHGVPSLLEAVSLLEGRVDLSVTMVGDGEQRKLAEAQVLDLGLEHMVTFLAPVPERELHSLISSHEIVLGIFGSSAKASSVIANKVWQGLASGKIVVTRSSVALDEIKSIVSERLVQVNGETPIAISAAIMHARNLQFVRTADVHVADALERYVSRRFDDFARGLLSRLNERNDSELFTPSHKRANTCVSTVPYQRRTGGF